MCVVQLLDGPLAAATVQARLADDPHLRRRLLGDVPATVPGPRAAATRGSAAGPVSALAAAPPAQAPGETAAAR